MEYLNIFKNQLEKGLFVQIRKKTINYLKKI